MNRRRLLMLLAALLMVILSGCGSKTTTPQAGRSSSQTANPNPSLGKGNEGAGDNLAKAETIYKENCISCHGANLEGRIGPTTNLQKVGSTLTKEQIINQIQNGGNGMPVFKTKLKEEEITVLAAWLSAKK